MAKEERLNKIMYKLLIIVIKSIPFIIAAFYILDLLLQFFGIDTVVLGYIAHITIIPWLFMYLSSFVFKFCIVHRLPLYYILIEDIVVIADSYIGLPVSTIAIYEIHFAIIGLFLFLILYLHQRETRYDRLDKRTTR